MSGSHANAMRRYWADPVWRGRQLKALRLGSREDRDGKLYVAKVEGHDAVKIGYSTWPTNRMNCLRAKYKLGFELLAETPATPATERRLHRHLRAHALPHLGGTEFYPISILNHPAIPAELRGAAA